MDAGDATGRHDAAEAAGRSRGGGQLPNETQFAPPTYASCIPPAAFDAAEWTEVVNEILSEIYLAEQVVNHFTDIETMRKGLFESATNSLPAIANDLQIAGAANNTTSFNLQGFFAGATGIAASIAGLAPGGDGGQRGVVGGLGVDLHAAVGLPDGDLELPDNLRRAARQARDGARRDGRALTSQRQQVLGDQGLLGLVGRLRSQGTWIPDTDGMLSASRQSFVLETYQALLPTMY